MYEIVYTWFTPRPLINVIYFLGKKYTYIILRYNTCKKLLCTAGYEYILNSNIYLDL